MGCHTSLTNNSSKCPGQKTSQCDQILFYGISCRKQDGKDGICCCHIHPLGIHRLSLFLYDKYSQLRTHIMKQK